MIDKEVDFYEDNEANERRNRFVTVKSKANNISDKNISILTEGRCASATGQLLAVVKHNKLVTIIGEESGGTYSTHPGMGVGSLKNTKLAMQIGVERESVNVDKFELNRGIIPDIIVEPKLIDFINNEDALLNYIFKMH